MVPRGGIVHHPDLPLQVSHLVTAILGSIGELEDELRRYGEVLIFIGATSKLVKDKLFQHCLLKLTHANREEWVELLGYRYELCFVGLLHQKQEVPVLGLEELYLFLASGLFVPFLDIVVPFGGELGARHEAVRWAVEWGKVRAL